MERVSGSSIKLKVCYMSTLQLNSELYRQLSYIADDEDCMQKVLRAVKRIAANKTASMTGKTSRTKKQLTHDFEEALAEVEAYKQGKVELLSAENLLDEL